MSTRVRMPNPPRSVAALAAPVLGDLDKVERVVAATLADDRTRAPALIAHLDHYRGKRLRPMLVLLAGRACGGVTPAHHVCGAVVEMIHTATLVHDDVLDDADTRRHVRTVNALWGNKGAILLGDLLFTHAFHLSSTLGDADVCELIGRATNRVCAGELQQICLRGNLELTEAEYFDIIDGKTAALTAVACELGARAAHATPDVVAAMERFGRYLGQAFQVADDLLDLVGDEAAAGKTLGTDLEQQKMTLPLIHLLETADAADAGRYRTWAARANESDRRNLLAALRDAGALDYTRHRAGELVAAAQAELDCLVPSDARAALGLLAEWAIDRQQ